MNCLAENEQLLLLSSRHETKSEILETSSFCRKPISTKMPVFRKLLEKGKKIWNKVGLRRESQVNHRYPMSVPELLDLVERAIDSLAKRWRKTRKQLVAGNLTFNCQFLRNGNDEIGLSINELLDLVEKKIGETCKRNKLPTLTVSFRITDGRGTDRGRDWMTRCYTK